MDTPHGGMMSVFSSPIVLGGGALLGLLIMLRKPSAGSSGNSGDFSAAYGTASAAASAAYAQVQPALISAQVSMNTAALGAEVAKTSIAADLGKANYQQDTTRQANVLSYLGHVDDNATVVRTAAISSQAGIINNQITTAANVQIDANANATRLGLAYVDRDTALGTAWAGVAIAAGHDSVAAEQAQYQYLGVKAAAKASTIGTIVGGVVGTAAIAGKALA